MDFIPDWKQQQQRQGGIRLRVWVVLGLATELSAALGGSPEPLPAGRSHWEGFSEPGREERGCQAAGRDSTCN